MTDRGIPLSSEVGECESLPHFCRLWREQEGYTQEYIGMKGGVTRACVSRFEAGAIHSRKALYGYLSLGMPLPYELIKDYLKGSD